MSVSTKPWQKYVESGNKITAESKYIQDVLLEPEYILNKYKSSIDNDILYKAYTRALHVFRSCSKTNKKNTPTKYVLEMLLKELKEINKEGLVFEETNFDYSEMHAKFVWYLETTEKLFDIFQLVNTIRPDLLLVNKKTHLKLEESVANEIKEIIDLIQAVKVYFSEADDDESVIDFYHLDEMILEFGRHELGTVEWYTRENIVQNLTENENELKQIIKKLKKKRIMTRIKKRAKAIRTAKHKLSVLQKEHPFPEDIVTIIGDYTRDSSSK